MKVSRKRYRKGGKFHSVIQLQADAADRERLKRARLMDMKIQLRAGSLIGKGLGVMALIQAFQAHVNRVRNRWSVAIVRTSGSVFIDFLIAYVKLIIEVFRLLFRAIFGRRRRVADLLRGITVSSKRVEDVKEAETFIFISIAALHHALNFAEHTDREDLVEGDSYKNEILGLTFAGAAIAAEAGGNQLSASGLASLAPGYEEDDPDDAEFADAGAGAADAIEIPA